MNIILDYSIRIAVSFLCGLLLGLERRSKQRAVGIRTISLISVSSALLAILSIDMTLCGFGQGDPTRIVAGVVTGIGFIGGGAILRQGFNISGITTAAIIFTASAIGLSCGAGMYIPAVITLIASIIILYALNKVERRFFPAAKNKQIALIFESAVFDSAKIESILKSYGLLINDTNIAFSVKKNHTKVIYSIKTPDSLNAANLAAELKNLENLKSLSIYDR